MDTYESYYERVDKDENGRITLSAAINFMLGSDLPSEAVSQICINVDQNNNGLLERQEFYNALKLVSVAQSEHGLTPRIMNAVLYSPSSLDIPAPRIKTFAPLAATSPTPSAPPMVYSGYTDNLTGSPTTSFSSPRTSPEASCNSHQLQLWPKFSQSDISKYNQLFEETDKDGNGTISWAEVRNLFLCQEVPADKWERIWMLAKEYTDGVLTKAEFFVALYLVQRHREGWFLPAKLPPSLRDEILQQVIASSTYQSPTQHPITPVSQLGLPLRVHQAQNVAARPEIQDIGLDTDEVVKLKHELSMEKRKCQEVEHDAAALREKLNKATIHFGQLKEQLDIKIRQLQQADNQILALRQALDASDHTKRELEYELVTHLSTLQEQYNQLQLERNGAVDQLQLQRHHANQLLTRLNTNIKFSLSELREATQSFSDSRKIGEGGYGAVYKGFLWNIAAVAVKKLHPNSLQGQDQYEREVSILSKARHPNLVILIGACTEGYILVYEFLPNGSLEDRLNCVNNAPPLSWQSRTRIIGEICCALIYLHKNEPNPIVHGDLKPDNILLDANLVCKLSDFGIARCLLDRNSNNTAIHCTLNPVGTAQYIDPEYMSNGELTVKSDVYSFGITVLRLLTGKSPVGIVSRVKAALGDLHSIVDPLAGDWPLEQALQLAEIGLSCASVKRADRPDLQQEIWSVVEPLMKAASETSPR